MEAFHRIDLQLLSWWVQTRSLSGNLKPLQD